LGVFKCYRAGKELGIALKTLNSILMPTMNIQLLDPSFVFNPYDRAFHADPYPTHEYLRTRDPIHKSIFNTWVVTSYAHAESILRDARFEVDNLPSRLHTKAVDYNEPAFDGLSQVIDKWINFVNPPAHGRLKKVLSPSFTQQVIESIRPYVSGVVDKIFDDFCSHGKIDMMLDLAGPVTALTIAKFLGLRENSIDKLIEWCTDTVFIFDQPATLGLYKKQSDIMIDFADFFNEEIINQLQQPRPGLLGHLVSQQSTDAGLSDDKIISTSILLSATGQESTKGLIGNGTLALISNPKSIKLLVDNPDLIESAVEELLRYDSSIQFVARKASQDIQISDKLISKGEYVIIYLAAANRDPNIFTEPDTLNFYRTKKHLGFGGGIHYCVGSYLAKLETEVILSSLTRRYCNLRIATDSLERS